MVVCPLDVARWLQLSSGDPARAEGDRCGGLTRLLRGKGSEGVGERGEFGDVRCGSLQNLGLRVLDDGLETEGQSRGEGVKEGDKVDSSGVEEPWVDGFEGEGVVWAEMVVLDLDHRLSRFAIQLIFSYNIHHESLSTDLALNLGHIGGRPSLVCSHSHSSLSIDTSL